MFRLHRSVGAHLHQNIMVRSQRDEVVLKLMIFSYFRDYILNKIIKEIGKIRTKKFFHSLEGAKSMAKLDGAMAGLAPLDPPLHTLNEYIHIHETKIILTIIRALILYKTRIEKSFRLSGKRI